MVVRDGEVSPVAAPRHVHVAEPPAHRVRLRSIAEHDGLRKPRRPRGVHEIQRLSRRAFEGRVLALDGAEQVLEAVDGDLRVARVHRGREGGERVVRNVAAASREHDVLDVAEDASVAEDATEGLRIGEQDPGADVEQVRLDLRRREVAVHGTGHAARSDDSEHEDVHVQMVLLENRHSFVALQVEARPKQPREIPRRGTDARRAPRLGIVGGAPELRNAPRARLVAREQDPVAVLACGGVRNLLQRDWAQGQPEPRVQADRRADERQIRQRHEDKHPGDRHLHTLSQVSNAGDACFFQSRSPCDERSTGIEARLP